MKKNSLLIFFFTFTILSCRSTYIDKSYFYKLSKNNIPELLASDISNITAVLKGSNSEFSIDTIIPELNYIKIVDTLFDNVQYYLLFRKQGCFVVKTEYDWATTTSNIFYLDHAKKDKISIKKYNPDKILKHFLNERGFIEYERYSNMLTPLDITFDTHNNCFIITAFDEPDYDFMNLSTLYSDSQIDSIRNIVLSNFINCNDCFFLKGRHVKKRSLENK